MAGTSSVPLVATYRWQLTVEDDLAAAAAAVGDLARLGVSHLYLSPIAEAVPGSKHGYDVTDPTRVRAELGGEQALAELAAAAHEAGLGLVVDVVPNHLAAHPANPWWWDVLRLGRSSAWAPAFDIDWDPPKRELAERVLLPILADHYGRALEAGELTVGEGGAPGRLLVVRYHEHELPLSPAATAVVLGRAAQAAGDDVLAAMARLAGRVGTAPPGAALTSESSADLAVAERLALARMDEPRVAAALSAELGRLARDADGLDALLDGQHYRLAYWRTAATELDYRRFFDIDTLVATRVERPWVHDAVHALPLRLWRDGLVDGLRVDHVDGLRDPAATLERLAGAVTGARIWVEKILRREEALPDWPVAGTTGYEVADLIGAWSTDPDGARQLEAAWRARTGEDRDFAAVSLECRRAVLGSSLAADVERLTEVAVRVCEARRRHRDHPRAALRAALVELAAHAPGYRSYVRFLGEDAEVPVVSDADRGFVAAAVAGLCSAPDVDPELVDLLADVLVGRLRGPDEAELVARFQQLTGPVAAKGEEDTALYRYLPLPHRCEVGADPGRPTLDAAGWHAAAEVAQLNWPERLCTLGTHDTKRSSDVRARLAALTTHPGAVVEAFDAWCEAWAGAMGPAAAGLVDAGSAWLAFHALVGAAPASAGRVVAAVRKSLREANLRTSWTDPDEEFEQAVERILVASGPRGDPAVAASLDALVAAVTDPGRALSLASVVLAAMAPGVPDLYQGAEGWDLSLVDPDNRRPVDAARRSALVSAAGRLGLDEVWRDPAARADGVARAVVLARVLGARREHAAAVGPGPAGAYRPLVVEGADAVRVLAFARGDPEELVAVVARPGPHLRVPADASVELPPGSWREVLWVGAVVAGGGRGRAGRFELASLPVPVALLERSGGPGR